MDMVDQIGGWRSVECVGLQECHRYSRNNFKLTVPLLWPSGINYCVHRFRLRQQSGACSNLFDSTKGGTVAFFNFIRGT